MQTNTFVMLKPDALERNLVDEIIDYIKSFGFSINRLKEVIVNEDNIIKHYDDVIRRIGRNTFKKLVLDEFENRKVIIIELIKEGEDVVRFMRDLIGATDPVLARKETIRGKYGIDSLAIARDENRMLRNLIHASESYEDVKREIDIWFNHHL
ncbi:nucleoside-diphosphate kinase [Liberiplasma polymorphum]|uniref:nucleoside-diphosphate kinase n=1 Tax=Liberiplasma polymorphum TaxID=3374570 RepID=UPI003771C436